MTREKRVRLGGFSGFHWGSRSYIMGIINVTPDSFSDDGVMNDPERAVTQGYKFQQQGADILDVGGESTRPGHVPISVAQEMVRVIPVLKRLCGMIDVPVSIDTYKSQVAVEAVKAGASIINDVWGLKYDPALAEVAATYGTGLILMHNQKGNKYRDLIPDIIASLTRSLALARDAGVPKENIAIDPGIGFGKTPEQNLEILRRLQELKSLGCPILVGTSRKSTIGLVLKASIHQRLEGTAATVAVAIANGADMVRVHDVREMALVCRMSDAIIRGWTPS